MQDDVGRRIQLLNQAVFHDGDTVGKTQGFFKIMGDKEDGLLQQTLKPQEFILHFLTDQRIQRRKRFIQQPDIRLDRQGSSNAHALLLATR